MMTLPRTNEIEKFDKGRKDKWLRYRNPSVSDVQTDASNQGTETDGHSNTQTDANNI